MTGSLTHRGPDQEGSWVEGGLALGIRRLCVVDLAGGRQPMANEDGRVRTVFNGEIYNHAELRRELRARGHRFRTASDTEAIVHAFEEWGEACVERFNGMFALAVWDAHKRQLFLARDRLGIKPLYVHAGPYGIAFASELKGLLPLGWIEADWDPEAVDDFLTYEYVPGPRTILRDVQKVPPATTLLFEQGKVVRRLRYWSMAAGGGDPVAPSDAAGAARELRRRLADSVQRRLMADVPLGVFLSGGIDSTVLAGLMSEASPDPVRSFSLGFADRSYDERAYARLAAERHGTLHREGEMTPDAVDLAGRLADHLDEPFADVSVFPTFLVSRWARQEVTVALSGDGGDELFAGYDHYRADRWAARLRRLTASGAWPMVDRLLDRLPPGHSKKGAANLAKRFAEGLRRPADLEHARWWVFWDLQERRQLYGPGLREAIRGRDCFGHYRQRLAEASDAGFHGLQRQLYADVTGYLVDDILTKVDRMSMAVSLETRVPFLDHEVVEYAMSMPGAMKLRGGQNKWILRRAAGDLLPPAIRRRGKEGFSIPMKTWLRGPLRPLLAELAGPRRIRERGWFDAAEVDRLVSEHVEGRANHAHRLWCVMSLELSLQSLSRRIASPRQARQPGQAVVAS